MAEPVLRVIQVIPLGGGGGAELLVNELVGRLPTHGIACLSFVMAPESPVAGGGAGRRAPLGRLYGLGVRARLRDVITREAAKGTPVLVHGHMTAGLYTGGSVARACGVPFVFTEHDTDNRRRHWPGMRLVERAAYRRCAQIIAISEGVGDALLGWIGRDSASSLAVIHNGARMYAPRLRDGSSVEGAMRLLAVGSLIPKKGFDVLIDAVAGARDIPLHLTVAGRGPERERLLDMARERGVGDRVELVGWVDDLQPLLDRADVFAIPSRWEGFGLVAVEAMSAGLPVIASDVPGLREVVGPSGGTGLLAAPGSPEAWSRAIRHLWEHRREWGRMSEEAHRRAQRFSLDEMVAKCAAVYREIGA